MIRALRLGAFELRRFTRGRLPRAAIAVAVCVPLLYGALYLDAYWDPTGRLDQLPAALVVEDEPVQVSGERLAAGQDLARELRERKVFGWDTVSAGRARAGLVQGDYAIVLRIPHDFSASLASPARGEPRLARLHVRTDDAQNYLAGEISRAAFSEIRAAASARATKRYVHQMLVSLETASDRTARAASGAGRLADGLDRARTGSSRLAEGAGRAASGAERLADGADRLSSGAERLSSGLDRLRDGTRRLAGGADRLAGGAVRVADGTRTAAQKAEKGAQGSGRLARGADRVVQALELYEDTHPVISQDPSFQQALRGARRLADGADRLHRGIEASVPGAHRLADGSGRLADGSARLADGADRLDSGAARAADGAARLSTGASRLSGGADRLAAGNERLGHGADRLQDGLVRAAGGSDSLAAGMHRGAKRLDVPLTRQGGKAADEVSNPVRLDRDRLHPAGTYGTGFTPYFVGLALWIGGIVTFLVLRPLSQRALATTASEPLVAIAGWLPAAALHVAQALVLLGVLVGVVGLRPEHPLLLAGFLSLAAVAFAAVQQWLHAQFGPAGRLAAIVVLMLQLTSSGGTYPVETTPAFYQAIGPFLPMTYVVEGMRPLLTGGDLTPVQGWSGVLVAFVVGGLALTSLTARRARTWTVARLHPELAF